MFFIGSCNNLVLDGVVGMSCGILTEGSVSGGEEGGEGEKSEVDGSCGSVVRLSNT